MRDEIIRKCEHFITSRDKIKAEFGWESVYMYPMCAEIYLSKDKGVDVHQLRTCIDLIKEKVGIFSNFRSIAKLPIATMLAVSENPEIMMNNALKVYELLKSEFFTSSYLPLVAVIIAELAQPYEYEQIARRTRTIYDQMKTEHPFLTSSDDSAFAALLALSNLSDQQIVQEVEKCYQILKPQFFSGNSVQSLSHVLALIEGDATEKCNSTMNLFNKLKERGYKYGTGYELPNLGVLALSGGDVDMIVSEIIEVDNYLSKQKGFGIFGIGSKQRLMYAGMLLQDNQTTAQSMQTAAINGTISLIVAEQTAICAAIVASSAASSSASS